MALLSVMYSTCGSSFSVKENLFFHLYYTGLIVFEIYHKLFFTCKRKISDCGVDFLLPIT